MKTGNYQLNEAKMFADVTEGTAIIIDATSGVYYGMNGFGTAIYENLVAGSSAEEIFSSIKALEDIPAAFEENLDTFINQILAFEVMVPAESSSSRKAEIDLQVAEADSFVPVCTEYKDVQDLLFADPIHDVNEEEGWRPE